ncbi:MAG: hypothetical protein RSC38_01250 [Oscillospiraceae bacterium]
MIQPLSTGNTLFDAKTARTAAFDASKEQSIKDNANKKPKPNTDSFVKGDNAVTAGTYTKPEKLSTDQLRALNEARMTEFNKMLEGMLGTQVAHFNKATFANIKVSDADRAKAQAAISDGGEWSVNAVSERILDMAKSLSGGDASKFAELKNAVKKGFDAAEKAWGDKLPEISGKTYDKVMEGFDAWEKELGGKDTAK